MRHDDRPWEGPEPSGLPTDQTFAPLPTALAVFLAVAAPIVFGGIAVGVRADGSPRAPIMVAGVLVALAAAAVAFLALTRARERR